MAKSETNSNNQIAEMIKTEGCFELRASDFEFVPVAAAQR
jgi:hypothetical protein